MLTRVDYCQYLLSSQTNYTIINFSDYVDDLSDDRVRRKISNKPKFHRGYYDGSIEGER